MTTAVRHGTSVRLARGEFLSALGSVGLAASKGAAGLPITQCVHIAPQGAPGGIGADALRLMATDFDRTIAVVVPADGAEGFAPRAISCQRLAAIVAQLPEGPIELVSRGEHGVRITAGRARFDVAGLPADELPTSPLAHLSTGYEGSTDFAIDAPAFVRALVRCAACASDQMSRPTLMGVHVQAAKNAPFTIEATQGYAINREWIERATGPALDIIIPTPTVAVIAKLFGDCERLTLGLSGLRATIEADTATRLETRLIEGPFPDVERLFKPVSPSMATVDRVALLAAVKRVAALSQGGKDDLYVRFDWQTDHVIVTGIPSGGVTDVGEAEDVMPCDFAGAPLRIAFGHRLLTQVLSLRTADTIRLGFKNPESVMVLHEDGATRPQGLLMPRREPDRNTR